jgi:hypothetical protein
LFQVKKLFQNRRCRLKKEDYTSKSEEAEHNLSARNKDKHSKEAANKPASQPDQNVDCAISRDVATGATFHGKGN